MYSSYWILFKTVNCCHRFISLGTSSPLEKLRIGFQGRKKNTRQIQRLWTLGARTKGTVREGGRYSYFEGNGSKQTRDEPNLCPGMAMKQCRLALTFIISSSSVIFTDPLKVRGFALEAESLNRRTCALQLWDIHYIQKECKTAPFTTEESCGRREWGYLCIGHISDMIPDKEVK